MAFQIIITAPQAIKDTIQKMPWSQLQPPLALTPLKLRGREAVVIPKTLDEDVVDIAVERAAAEAVAAAEVLQTQR